MIGGETKHIGQNIRKIRLLRGMKQDTFAKHMGIAQQNVSKMENKKNVSEEQLKQASEVLNTSVETIKNFDERVIINNNVFSNDQINHPISEVLSYFKGEIDKKDEEIKRLREELAKFKTENVQQNEIGSNLRKINNVK